MDELAVKLTVLVATNAQLKNKKYYTRLWSYCRKLTHLSSRDWIPAIEYFFRDTDILGIQLIYPGGKPYVIPYIFELFPDDENERPRENKEENESAHRWMSDFLEADETGESPVRMSTKLERVRAIDLYMRSTVAEYSHITKS